MGGGGGRLETTDPEWLSGEHHEQGRSSNESCGRLGCTAMETFAESVGAAARRRDA
jgi:hypothetical protein